MCNSGNAGWTLRHWLSIGLACLLIGCSSGKSPEPAPVSSAPAAPPSAESDEDKTVLAVSKAIRKHLLTDRADECLSFHFDPVSVKDAYVVEIRENHRHAKCGGDPNTSPRLFSIRVSKSNGSMTTDHGSASGEFHAIAK